MPRGGSPLPWVLLAVMLIVFGVVAFGFWWINNLVMM